MRLPSEAITSRPLLLAAVGRAAHSGGQTTLYLTPMHGKANLLKPLIANIHAALQHAKEAAEQFKPVDRWAVLLRYVSDKIATAIGSFRLLPGLPATGSLPVLGSRRFRPAQRWLFCPGGCQLFPDRSQTPPKTKWASPL
ncbi:MAG: hypothetical protein QE285_14175 [Aquabacterium sp.]|nr:hypothetical protein [Aquabacterium sp.]